MLCGYVPHDIFRYATTSGKLEGKLDLVDLIEEKRFLGQEFLTWLWWKSEERGGTVFLDDFGEVGIAFEKHMLLESGEGESSEKLICSGLQTELVEARTGLQVGKKLEQARVVLTRDSHEYGLTLSGALMEFRNVRLPKTEETEQPGGSVEEIEGKILERVFLFEDLVKIIHSLFSMFLKIRLGQEWPQQLLKIREWVGSTPSKEFS